MKVKKQQKAPETLEAFADTLLQEKGLDALEREVYAQAREDLASRLEERINALMLRNMPEEKLEEFEKVIDEDNENATQAFCRANIPDLEEKIASELLAFRATYLA